MGGRRCGREQGEPEGDDTGTDAHLHSPRPMTWTPASVGAFRRYATRLGVPRSALPRATRVCCEILLASSALPRVSRLSAY